MKGMVQVQEHPNMQRRTSHVALAAMGLAKGVGRAACTLFNLYLYLVLVIVLVACSCILYL